MKLTKEQLKRIIKEELENVLEGQSEMFTQYGLQGSGDWGAGSPAPSGADVKGSFKKFLRAQDVPSIIRGNDMMRKYAEAFLASEEGSPWDGSVDVEDFVGRGSRGGLFKLDYYQEDTGVPDAWDIGIYVEG